MISFSIFQIELDSTGDDCGQRGAGQMFLHPPEEEREENLKQSAEHEPENELNQWLLAIQFYFVESECQVQIVTVSIRSMGEMVAGEGKQMMRAGLLFLHVAFPALQRVQQGGKRERICGNRNRKKTKTFYFASLFDGQEEAGLVIIAFSLT